MSRDTETKTPLHFTLQEVVQRSGLSEYTLRYYERIGLLKPVKRDSSSNHRRYTAEDVQRIETLACLRATGMSIEDMRKYLSLLENGKAAADHQLTLFKEQKKALEQEMAHKQEHLRYLEQKVAYWQAIQRGDDAKAREIGEIATGLAKQIIKNDQTLS
jgi:DNA-binding transcriptional MerR regulator